MPHDPFPMIVEYLRSPDMQVRKNALTALSVLGTDRSVEAIIKLAMDDRHPEDVRERAEKELVRLQESGQKHAAAAIQKQMNGDPKTALRAYLLAGRIQSRGVPIGPPELSWTRRVQLAFQSHFHLKIPVLDRLRLVVPALLGGLAGALLFASVLFLTRAIRVDYDDSVTILFYLVLSGTLFAMAAGATSAIFATPVPQQVDRFATLIVEPLLAALGSLALVMAGLLFWLFTSVTGRQATLGADIVLLLELALVAACVRVATIIAHGVVRGRWRNTLIQTAAGASFGIMILTLIPIFLTDPDMSMRAKDIWYFAVPACFGLACAFARIDNPASPQGPRPGWIETFLTMSLGAVLVGVLLLAGWVGMSERGRGNSEGIVYKAPRFAQASTPVDTQFVVGRIPRRIKISLQRPASFGVAVRGDIPGTDRDVRVAILNTPYERDDPPTLVGELAKGEYMLSITKTPLDEFEDVAVSSAPQHVGASQYDELSRVLARRIGRRGTGVDPERAGPGENFMVRVAIGLDGGTMSFVTASDSVNYIDEVNRSLRESRGPSTSNTSIDACQKGTLWGLHGDPRVVNACERALQLSTTAADSASAHSWLGLNRALNSDLAGAAQAFQAALRGPVVSEEEHLPYGRWIQTLKSGANPIDAEVLQELRDRERRYAFVDGF